MLGEHFQKSDIYKANFFYLRLLNLKYYETEYMQYLAENYQQMQDYSQAIEIYKLML